MRLEYSFELSEVGVPRFSVEVIEGIGKLFTLATLVLNVLQTRPKVEIVFHGPNREDPVRRIENFREIVGSSEGSAELVWEMRKGGQVSGSSSYYQWVSLERA